MLSVIGIHSKIEDKNGQVSLTSGHAWLTTHYTNGRLDSVGLWPDDHDFPRWIVRDPIGFSKETEEKFQVRWGWEIHLHYKPFASRYYGLRQGEQGKAIGVLGHYTGWRLTNNCTTWATDKVKEIFGLLIHHSECFGIIDTPRSLGSTLKMLELRRPTSTSNPLYP